MNKAHWTAALVLAVLTLHAGCEKQEEPAASVTSIKTSPTASSAATVNPTTEPVANASGPETWITDVVAKVGRDSFDEFYDADIRTAKFVADVQRDEPKFAWDQKLAAHRAEAKKEFMSPGGGSLMSAVRDLAALLAFKPHSEIVEVRPMNGTIAVWVRLTYDDPANAPLRVTRGVNVYKEIVGEFDFDSAGTFKSFSWKDEHSQFFDQPRPLIAGVYLLANPGDMDVECHFLGQEMARGGKMTIGVPGGFKQQVKGHDSNNKLGVRAYQVLDPRITRARGINVTIDAESGGVGDSGSLTMPQFSEPWVQTYLPTRYADNRWKTYQVCTALGLQPLLTGTLSPSSAATTRAAGANQPDDVRTLLKLADSRKNEQKFDESAALYRRALTIIDPNGNGETESIGVVLTELATVNVAQNKFDEARVLLARSISISEKALGPNDPAVAAGLRVYGAVLLALNQVPEAASASARATAIETQAATRASKDIPARASTP